MKKKKNIDITIILEIAILIIIIIFGVQMEVELLKQAIKLLPIGIERTLLLVLLIWHFWSLRRKFKQAEEKISLNEIDIKSTYQAMEKESSNGFTKTRLRIKKELLEAREMVKNVN